MTCVAYCKYSYLNQRAFIPLFSHKIQITNSHKVTVLYFDKKGDDIMFNIGKAVRRVRIEARP